MKWGDFKKLVEDAGVTDDMNISYIDVCDFICDGTVEINKKTNSFYVSD